MRHYDAGDDAVINLWMTRESMSDTFREMPDELLSETIDDAHRLLRGLVYSEGDMTPEPASYAWRTYESALVIYGQLACMEYSMQRRIHDLRFWDFSRAGREMMHDQVFYFEKPPWFQDVDVLRSHRSALIRAGSGSWARTPATLPLLWPVVSEEDEGYALKVSKADIALLKSGKYKLDKATKERVSNVS